MGDDGVGFGALLRACRLSARSSQEDLAGASGMSVREISDLERGRIRRPYPHSVQRLAEALGLRGEAREQLIAAAGRRLAAGGAVGATTGPSAARVRAAGERAVPRQLPGPVRQFAGREAELAALTSLLEGADSSTPPAAVISAIGGTAGVGKTALAVHWAHQVAERFPDGQLYVNLRGYDAGEPVTASDALASFLRALGVLSQDIPGDLDERAAAYRSLVAGRRMLVMLDNARQVEQVRPLLPGSPACVTVVTSRDALAGLVAADGALRLEVDLLPLPQATGLLRGLIGSRADDEPDAVVALATQCCRLPLALRVAAELAAARPDVPLAVLAGELADLQHRLDVLETGGDERTAVRSVFTWSYRHLDPDAARLFRLLGLHPGLDLDVHAAAALAAATATAAAARRMLDSLARAHLTQPAGPGRNGLHDLLRAYARELAWGEGSEDERRAALTRLFDFYLHAASTAMDTLFPAERHRRPRIPAPPAEVPRFTDAARALEWLDAERSNLTAVTVHAATQGWPAHATRLSATLFRYLDTQGHHPEATAIHTHACQAARQAGDAAGEADACNSLGVMSMRQGRLGQAAERFENALTLYRQTASQAGQARALSNLGFIEYMLGRPGHAPVHLRGAVELFREAGDQVGEARTLASLGYVGLRQGSYQQAAGHLRRSLALCQKVADRGGQARALCYLGEIESRLGRFSQATAQVQQALALFQELGDRISEADALASLGLIDLRQRHYDRALAHLKHALAVSEQTGDLSSLAGALNSLGEVLLATGRPAQARRQLVAALDTAIQAGEKYEQARAHHGLSRACQASGHLVQAGHHQTQALTLYTDLGAPEASQIRAQLADGHHEVPTTPVPQQTGRRRRSTAAGRLQPGEMPRH